MTEVKQKQRNFDIAEYADKVRAALVKLESTQQPGEQSGKGGKTDVLKAAELEIKALAKKGYTAKQIADAIKNDVFGILPKTITEMTTNKPVEKRKKVAVKQANDPVEKRVTQAVNKQAASNVHKSDDGDKSTFAITPDSDDL